MRKRLSAIISGDEAKTQTCCEARDIAEQIVQAGQQKDNEKVEELAGKLTEQSKEPRLRIPRPDGVS